MALLHDRIPYGIVNDLAHGLSPRLFVVLLHLTLPLLRLGLFVATRADTDTIIVLGFDLLLIGQFGETLAALVVNRPALFVFTGTAALTQPVEKVQVAAGAILVPHRHAVDQGIGEPLDPPQSAGLTRAVFCSCSCAMAGGRQVRLVVLKKYSGSQSAKSRLGLSGKGRDCSKRSL